MPSSNRPPKRLRGRKGVTGFAPYKEGKAQIAVWLSDEGWDVVSAIARPDANVSRAEVVRRFVDLGIAAARAAAEADRAGEDAVVASMEAVREANRVEVERAVLMRLVDVVNDHLDEVRARDPEQAIVLGVTTAMAFHRWAQEHAEFVGTTPQDVMERVTTANRIAAQEALAGRLMVGEAN